MQFSLEILHVWLSNFYCLTQRFKSLGLYAINGTITFAVVAASAASSLCISNHWLRRLYITSRFSVLCCQRGPRGGGQYIAAQRGQLLFLKSVVAYICPKGPRCLWFGFASRLALPKGRLALSHFVGRERDDGEPFGFRPFGGRFAGI